MRAEGWKLPQLNFKNPWLVAMVTERCIPLPWQQANTEVCCWDWGFGMWPEGVGVGGWAWAVAVLCVGGGEGGQGAMQPQITHPLPFQGSDDQAGCFHPSNRIRGERRLGVIP